MVGNKNIMIELYQNIKDHVQENYSYYDGEIVIDNDLDYYFLNWVIYIDDYRKDILYKLTVDISENHHVEYYIYNYEFHNMNGPAIAKFYNNKRYHASWYMCGMLHRYSYPAIIDGFYSHNNVEMYWYVDDEMTNRSGPSYLNFCMTTKKILEIQWTIDDCDMGFNDWLERSYIPLDVRVHFKMKYNINDTKLMNNRDFVDDIKIYILPDLDRIYYG